MCSLIKVIPPLWRLHQPTRDHRLRTFCSHSVASKPAATADAFPAGWDSARPFDEIPGPSKLQLLRYLLPGGPMHDTYSLSLQRFLRNEYGPLAKLPGMLGKPDIIFTSDPRHFELIYATEGSRPVRRFIEAFNYYRKELRPELFQGMGGLVSDQGENWYTLRQVINPLLLSPKIVRMYMPAVDEIAREFVAGMGLMRDDKGEMPADFMDHLSGFALETTGRMALDRRLGVMQAKRGDDVNHLAKSIRDFLRLSFLVEMKPPIWRYYKTKEFRDLIAAFDIVTEFFVRYVDEAKTALEANRHEIIDCERSVLQKLLETNPLYAFLTVYDLMFAGIDATAAATGFLLHHLAIHPEKQDLLREEVFRLLPEKESEINEVNLVQFRYLRACLKESMRLQPQVPANLRGTVNNIVLNGYRIPANTDLFMTNHLLQTSDEYFSKSKTFLPERWMRDDAEAQAKLGARNPFVYLPFGFGARACVGRRFAEMALVILMSRILREYRVEWHYGSLEFAGSLVNAPHTAMKFKLIPL